MSSADELSERDRLRAQNAITDTICSMHMTDGFCRPDHKPDCRCHTLGRAAVTAMATRGVVPVWEHSPERREAAEKAAQEARVA